MMVLIRDVNNVNDTKLFNSIKDCIAYLNTITSSSKTSKNILICFLRFHALSLLQREGARTTLFRHIESKTPYHNYICE